MHIQLTLIMLHQFNLDGWLKHTGNSKTRSKLSELPHQALITSLSMSRTNSVSEKTSSALYTNSFPISWFKNSILDHWKWYAFKISQINYQIYSTKSWTICRKKIKYPYLLDCRDYTHFAQDTNSSSMNKESLCTKLLRKPSTSLVYSLMTWWQTKITKMLFSCFIWFAKYFTLVINSRWLHI